MEDAAAAAAAGALALSLGVIGRSPPSACAGALSADRLAAAAVPLVLLEEEEGEGDANEEEEELCSDELTMGAEERRRRLVGRRGLGRVKVHLGPYLVLVIFDNHNLGI